MHVLFPFALAALGLSVVLPTSAPEPSVSLRSAEAHQPGLLPGHQPAHLPGHQPALQPMHLLGHQPVVGPPAICLPLEVSGRTLSWGDGALTPPKDYPLKKLRVDLIALLESEDTLTRMENLRRAAISLGPLHRTADRKEQSQLRIEILSSLRNRALTALLEPKQSAYAAQCVFDLGYLQAALTQVDGHKAASAVNPDFTDGEKELRFAAKLLPKDGALALGLALAVFDMRDGGADLAQFQHCARLASSDPMLRKNLKIAAHHFLGQEDYDELVRSMAD